MPYHDSTSASLPASPARRRLLAAALAGIGLSACTRRDPEPPAADPGAHATDAVLTSLAANTPARRIDDPDLLTDTILLPGLINSSSDGPFIDLVKAIDDAYRGGRMPIRTVPLGRLQYGVSRGITDVAFPAINALSDIDPALPFRFSTTPVGAVAIVIYSNRSRPVTHADLVAYARGGTPLRVHSSAVDWGFPAQPFTTLESALRRVDAGRMDALLWAQEEADTELRRLGLTRIHRELHGHFDDIFLLPKGPRGDFVDRTLTEAISRLREDGRLDPLYRRIHRPWDDWQLQA